MLDVSQTMVDDATTVVDASAAALAVRSTLFCGSERMVVVSQKTVGGVETMGFVTTTMLSASSTMVLVALSVVFIALSVLLVALSMLFKVC
jgi:hypothetical protein